MGQSTILRTHGLCKKYGDVLAVNKLDLEVHTGEVFGLLGPNGAGKTTTTLMLLGLTEPSAGTAYIDGLNCARDTLKVKRIVGYLPDSIGFYPDMTGRQNLHFTGQLNGLDRDVCARRAAALLRRVGLTDAADRKAGTYSRGMRQRLGIADVLMKNPKVVIMDEPTLGIDPEGMRELIALIRDLSVKDGRTILISSHQLYQIQQICDRVGIFVKGRLMACGPISELGSQLQSEGHYVLDVRILPADEHFATLVRALPDVQNLSQDSDGMFHIESRQDIRTFVLDIVVQNRYSLMHFHQRGGDLDEIYHRYFEKAGDEHEHASVSGPGKAKTPAGN